MADRSYYELLTATVALNLSDFKTKMKIADASVDSLATGKNIKKTGSNVGFTKAGDQLIEAAVDAMQKVVEKVMSDSLFEVPKDTLTLAESAMIEPAFYTTRKIIIKFGYGYGGAINPKTGRQAAQYALPVHEIYDATHDPPTKSHYLIDPLIENAPYLAEKMKAEMRGTKLSGEGKNFRVNRGVFLFRKGGGPGINPVLDPSGRIVKRKKRS